MLHESYGQNRRTGGSPRIRALFLAVLLTRIMVYWGLYPRGSKYPLLKDSGPKNHTLNGFWDQKILKHWVLGPSRY